MAHIYMTFDFGTDEEKAQQARHKLEGWKQAFRLDKKLLYKFERPQAEDGAEKQPEVKPAKKEAAKAEKTQKSGKAGKSSAPKGKAPKDQEPNADEKASGPVKLLVRLAFSGHEKMTEERWVKRIPSEDPFSEAAPQTIKAQDASFGEVENRFESLE
jgi:hypothetical protein